MSRLADAVPLKQSVLLYCPIWLFNGYVLMKLKEEPFELSSNAFFYATVPLRFSYECFALKYSQQFALYTIGSFYEQMFPENQDLVEFIAAFILSLMLLPIVCTIALVQTLPLAIAEIAVGLVAVLPALAIALASLPVVALLAVCESFFDLISNDDQESQEYSYQGF